MEIILQRLLAIDGVTGALLVGKDGLVIASTIEGDDEEMLGAMAAAAYDAAGRYIEQIDLGSLRSALFELASGSVQVVDGGDLLLVTRCVANTQLGRVRIEMQQASKSLAEHIPAY